MKKKILGGIALLAIAAVAVWNVNLNSQSNKLSGAMLANVEALAEENGGSDCKWKSIKCSKGNSNYEGCLTNGDGTACTCGSVSRDC
jgi:hypothetical protein